MYDWLSLRQGIIQLTGIMFVYVPITFKPKFLIEMCYVCLKLFVVLVILKYERITQLKMDTHQPHIALPYKTTRISNRRTPKKGLLLLMILSI